MNPEFERRLASGRHLFEARRYEHAARECEAALSLEPTRNDARLLLARCLRQLQRLDEARREVKTTLETHPDDTDALYMASLLARGRAEALSALESALALRPNAAYLHTHLAGIHLRSKGLGRRPSLIRAENAARVALKLNPRDALAHRYLAVALISLNRVGEARQHVLTSLSLHPENPRSHVLLSLLHNNQNDPASAESALREALRLDPDNRGLQQDLKIHLWGERIFSPFLAHDNGKSATSKIYRATFEKLPPLWRLPALVMALVGTMAALVTVPSQWMKPGDGQTAIILGLLTVVCTLFFNLNYAARPYLARVPQKFLPADLKPWGKPDLPPPSP